MKVLITGAGGQLGRALLATAASGVEVIGLRSSELDITDDCAVRRAVVQQAPALIVNAAAYTAVDRAESDEARSQQVNAVGVGHLASAAKETGARLVHISTDFVFDGSKSSPWLPDDNPAPLNAYGRTKLAGERAALAEGAMVVRTSWVYSAHGANFVRTMIRLMEERDHLDVVDDQVGRPTWAAGLARALWDLAEHGGAGVYHWADGGLASWYDFAVAIQEEAMNVGILTHGIPIRPIASAAYPTPARRPAWSVLDTRATAIALGRQPPHWRENLRRMLEELKHNG